ncbi:hypothetical protein R3P38DRAFT_2791898 [Favolaschia claudopus]|uniref:Uncharacterized protein n=1 Tax=Favolaschia claudopus TaxID=2862362 RepID=A0AAW0AGX7_9AGAR
MAFHTALSEAKVEAVPQKFGIGDEICLRLAESVCVVQVILDNLNSGEEHYYYYYRFDTCPPAAGKHSARCIYVPPQNRPLVDADLDSGPEYIEYLLNLIANDFQSSSMRWPGESVLLAEAVINSGRLCNEPPKVLKSFWSVEHDCRQIISELATSFKVEEKALGLVLVEQFGKLRTFAVANRKSCATARTLQSIENRDDPEVLERSGRDFRLSINVLGVESDSMSSLEDVIASTDEAGSSSEEAHCVAEFLRRMERRLNQDPFPDRDRDRFGPGRTRNCLSFPNAAVYVTWSVASVKRPFRGAGGTEEVQGSDQAVYCKDSRPWRERATESGEHDRRQPSGPDVTAALMHCKRRRKDVRELFPTRSSAVIALRHVPPCAGCSFDIRCLLRTWRRCGDRAFDPFLTKRVDDRRTALKDVGSRDGSQVLVLAGLVMSACIPPMSWYFISETREVAFSEFMASTAQKGNVFVKYP